MGEKITEFTEMTTGQLATGDMFCVVDIDTDVTKKIAASIIGEAFTTAYTRTLLDDTTAAAARTTLGVGDLGTLPMAAMADMTHLLYPSTNGGYGELYLNGWEPIGFNQQWGGPWGGDRPNGDGNQEWFPTGYIEEDGTVSVGAGAASTWRAQAFKVPETITADALWLKVCKAADPQKDAEPLAVYISSAIPGGGNTPITNGTMDTIDGPGFAGESMASASEPWPLTSNTECLWYRFTDASGSFSLTKDTTYYIVIEAQGEDAANYFKFTSKNSSANNYPHGNLWTGDDGGAAGPTNWTEDTSQALSFLIESSAGTDLLQSGGVFDGMLEFGEGTPTNESRCMQRPLKDFWNDEVFTMRLVTGALTASKTVLDINYGLLHKDRIRLYVDGSNHLVLVVYESDGTTHTITGTTDVTAAATFDIMFSIRMQADGSDFVKLYVDGSTEGTQLSSKTITIDPLLKEVGHIILGGGFPAAPTWDKDYRTNQLAGGNLPSNDGDTAWTTTTAATEVSAMIILDDDSLWQNGAYYAVGNEDGYYTLTLATMTETTGAQGTFKFHLNSCVNTAGERACDILWRGNDAGDYAICFVHEYYMEVFDGTNTFMVQHNFLKNPAVLSCSFKGSSYFIYLNGKLVVDGTGLFIGAGAAAGGIRWGDIDTTAASDADIVWQEILAYDAGPLWHEVNGYQLSEFACWNGDQTGLADELYNSGTNLSVKQVCGISKNYLKEFKIRHQCDAISSTITTASTTGVVSTDMEAFVLVPNRVFATHYDTVYNDTAGQGVSYGVSIDGDLVGLSLTAGLIAPGVTYQESEGANQPTAGSIERNESVLCGLHKVEAAWCVGANNGYSYHTRRRLIVGAE